MLTHASLKGFACPHEDFDGQMFSNIVREYAVSVLLLLHEKYGDALIADPAPLEGAVGLLSSVEHEGFLTPALGHCVGALKAGGGLAAAQRGVAQVMLALSAEGVPGTWAMEFAEPSSLHWDCYLLPEADRVEVSSDGAEARVIVRRGGRERACVFACASPSGAWLSDDARGMAHTQDGHPAILLPSGGDLRALGLPQPPVPPLEEVTAAHARKVSECLESLDEHIPSCTSWVRRVLKYVSLVHSPPGHLQSGTFKGFCGLIYMTDLDDRLKTAEALVHEASHQYFSTLACLGDMVKDAGKLFYSPFVRRDRPPDRILFAYHAFANVEMLYRGCLEAGVETGQCEKSMADMAPEVGAVERILLSEVELTPLGSSIFEPLVQRRSAYASTN